MPVLASAADAEARAAALVALHARAAAAAAAEGLDAKERGAADECLAMAAGALLAAWRLEGCPRSQRHLLQVLGLHAGCTQQQRMCACTIVVFFMFSYVWSDLRSY